MEVKRTGYSHGISATIRYIGDDYTKAHKNNNGVKKRNLFTIGIGVRSNGVKNTIHDFNLLNAKRRHNKVKSVNIILSPAPNEVDPNNPEQVRTFAQYAKEFVHKAFPHHLAYLAIQDDNRRKHIHCHCIVGVLSTIAPYRTLTRHQCDIYHIRKIANNVRKHFNKSQTTVHFSGLTQTGERTIEHQHNRLDEINDRMKPVLLKLKHGKYSNIQDLVKDSKIQGVIVKPRYKRLAKRDNHGKIIYKKYKTGKRKGKYRYKKNKHGNYTKIKILGKRRLVGFAFQNLPATYQDDNEKRKHANMKFNYVRGFQMSKINPTFRFQNIKYCIKHHHQLLAKYKLSRRPKVQSRPAYQSQSTYNASNIASNYSHINNRASSTSIQPRTNTEIIQDDTNWLKTPNYEPIISNTVHQTTTKSNYNRVARSIPLIIQTTPCGYSKYGDEVFKSINHFTHATPKQVGILGRMRSWIKDKTRNVYAKIRKPMIQFAKRWVKNTEFNRNINVNNYPNEFLNNHILINNDTKNDLDINTANLEPKIQFHHFFRKRQNKKHKSLHNRFKHWVGTRLLQFSHNIDNWLMPQYRLIHKHRAELSSASSADSSESVTLSAFGNSILVSERTSIKSTPTTVDKVNNKLQEQNNHDRNYHPKHRLTNSGQSRA